MANSEISIFYSWQSDLPGNTTRNIIHDSIKDAVRILRDTVEIVADRDTQGEFGAPDIAQTIFSKIDVCDIFIADVTAVCQYEVMDKDGNPTGKKKLMPNPNVMLELGYATKVVGWENVICILNTDYGMPDDMPFDIANRRLTPFSLRGGKSKSDVKKYIKDIIRDTVENTLANGKRTKGGFSNLKIGCYCEDRMQNEIIPYSITKSKKYVERKERIIRECNQLITEIRSIHLPVQCENEIKLQAQTTIEQQKVDDVIPFVRKHGTVLTPVTASLTIDLSKLQDIEIKDKNSIVELAMKFLSETIDIDSDFFDIGNLKRKVTFGIDYSYEYIGIEEEKSKYNKIQELDYKLHQVEMWEWYATTFDEYVIIPLAIENMSAMSDDSIDVFLKINTDEVEAIIPSRHLLNPEMHGLEGYIVEEDIIKDMLLMPETPDIQYDIDITYTIADTQAEMAARFTAAGINGNPRYNEKDYEREISKYIASPMEERDGEYQFYINGLRALEKKWLGAALLVKTESKSFNIEYLIKSRKSDGSLMGNLTCNL